MGACMSTNWAGRFIFGLVTGLAVLAATGCRSSPWSAKPRASTADPQPTQSAHSSPGAQTTQNTAGGQQSTDRLAGSTPAAQPSGDATGLPSVEQLLDQISQVEKLDPAARQRLEADLRQTDPALWPAVVQAFRAALAYRRQREERLGQGESAERLASTTSAPARAPAASTDQVPADSARDRPQTPPAESDPKAAAPHASGQRLPVPAAGLAERASAGQDAGKKETPSPPANVELAGYSEAPGGWQQHLAAALAGLEAELREASASPEVADKHARQRLLALVAGQREDALRPIPGVPPAVQDFWRQELYGLAVWLDSQRQDDPTRRAAEARQQLASALVPLGWVAPLVLRNLAFITEVHSYGDYKPFARYEFAPEQDVLLYVEIENFATEETPKGFHTVLEASYRIFDSRNQQVAEKQLGTTEEFCRNPRRDFFVVYHLRLPKRIYNGRHTLQLTVVDQKSKKVGQASVEFTIQEPSP